MERKPGATPLMMVERFIEAEGVVQWGDEGHRKRFLARLSPPGDTTNAEERHD